MRFKRIHHLIASAALLVAALACHDSEAGKTKAAHEKPFSYGELQLPDRPNILWLVAEDLSPNLPAFGDSTIATPALDRLAAEGVRYPNFFSPSGVCAPSRAAIALGMYPTRIGAMHMRTGPWYAPNPDAPATWGDNRRVYEAMPPAGTHMHSTYLRQAGYYAANNAKQDYQFRVELTAWDESSRSAHWRNRPEAQQPFFSIFNFEVTHESRIWAKAQDSLWVSENLEVHVPPYLPDTEVVRGDLRRMYSNILEMDRQIGEVLDQLEADGLLDNTIIFFYGDHGGPLPRSKRTMYDTGLRSPLIVRFPGGQKGGGVDKQLLSFLDLKPTVLSLAGIAPPENLDGNAWLGPYAAREKRQYLHAAADDFDGSSHGRLRAVRNSRFKYIRNYLEDQPFYNDVPYRKQMPSMQELLALKAEGRLDSIQGLWFGTQDNPEALYDTETDPFEVHNLVGDSEMQPVLEALREENERWVKQTGDLGMQPETEYLTHIWPDGKQPVTGMPEIMESNGLIRLNCLTQGASIGYQWVAEGDSLDMGWEVYLKPFPVRQGKTLVVRAHRIGYLPSGDVMFTAGE